MKLSLLFFVFTALVVLTTATRAVQLTAAQQRKIALQNSAALVQQRQAAASATAVPAKKKRRAFVVLGAESTGHHLCVQLLVQAGCAGGVVNKRGDWQKFDVPTKWEQIDENKLRTANYPECIVLHRSSPHGGVYVDLEKLSANIQQAGYELHFLAMVRSKPATLKSQVAEHHQRSSALAAQNFEHAKKHVIEFLGKGKYPYTLVQYELLEKLYYMQWLLDECKLSSPTCMPHPFNGDYKYFPE